MCNFYLFIYLKAEIQRRNQFVEALSTGFPWTGADDKETDFFCSGASIENFCLFQASLKKMLASDNTLMKKIALYLHLKWSFCRWKRSGF